VKSKKRRMPEFMRRCVSAVSADRGLPVNQAFAICTAQSQKHGYLKQGTHKATGKGRALSRKHKSQPDHQAKIARYERQLARARTEELAFLDALIGGDLFDD
jgi:hypothetical protein